MPGQLIRDVRATLDIDVQKAQRGLAGLEKSGQAAERALKDQEQAAKGYQRQLEKTGTAASQMRRRLEAATRALPKITIEADSSEADKKLAQLRTSLGELASKKIGIDVDGGTALEEMRRVKGELEALAASEADPIVRADVQIALREIRRVETELDKLADEGREVEVDVDTSEAVAEVGAAAAEMRRRLEAATGNLPKIPITADSSDADIKIANLRESLQGLAGQRIGIDVSSGQALTEVQRVKHELEELDRMTVDPVVKADVRSTLDELRRVESALGGVAETATRSLGVLGEVGPAQAGIAAAAIAALPTVAGVAASGIVLALGGALLTVGLTGTASSDRVKAAWSETASTLKAELADAAQPLEGSAIRAADVAVRTFEAIKPRLSRIWKDLVPDVDAFVNAAGRGVERLGPGLEKIGSSFGTLLSSLADRMPSIMGNLSDTFETFAGIMDEHPTMLADLAEDATALVSAGADVLSWMDELKVALAAPFGPAGSEAGVDYFFTQMFGASRQEIADGMAEFPKLMGDFNAAAAAGVSALHGLSGSGDAAAEGVRNLNTALEEHYDPAAKALDAEIKLKQALQEAAQAAKDKKFTELERLQSVQNVTKAISEAAKAEQEMTGKTKESGEAFMSQLPKLLEWAGKNEAAKGTVNGLAESLGITIGKAGEGVIAMDKFGNAVKILPNGKKVEIDASTAKGKAELAAFLLYVARQKGTVDVHVRTIYDTPSGRAALERKQNYARGGIAAGGVRLMAEGGVLQPMITEQAVYSPGNNAIFGEAGREAFIPYASQHRGRASDILAKVADDFGYLLINKAAKQTLDGMADKITLTSDQYQLHMGAVVDELDSTLGRSGSLTSAIGQVGTVGQSLVDGWTSGSSVIGDSVTEMGSLVQVSVTGMADTMAGSINGLTGAVEQLGAAVSAAQSSSGKSGVGATLTSGTIKRGSSSGVGATLTSGTIKSGKVGATLTSGSVPLQPQKVVLNPNQYGVHVGGGGVAYSAASMLQAATLKSVPAAGGGAAGGASAAGGGGSGELMSIGAFYASPDQSPTQIAQELDWIRRGG